MLRGACRRLTTAWREILVGPPGVVSPSPTAGLARCLGKERLDDVFQFVALALGTLDFLRLVFLDRQHFTELLVAFPAEVFVKRNDDFLSLVERCRLPAFHIHRATDEFLVAPIRENKLLQNVGACRQHDTPVG